MFGEHVVTAASSPTASRKLTCADYEPLEGSRRCRHYIQGGTCTLPDRFLCDEWVAVNQHRAPEARPGMAGCGEAGSGKAAQGKDTRPRDLFGNPLPVEPARKTARPVPATSTPTSRPSLARDDVEPRPALRGFTTEDIESFRQLNVEVCFRSEELGTIWLVPRYSELDRREITPEHAATVCRVLEAFPGSRVVAFEKSTNPAQEGSPA